jgi:hypothetical protein
MGACLGKQKPAQEPVPTTSYQQQVDVVQPSSAPSPQPQKNIVDTFSKQPEHVQQPLIQQQDDLRLKFQPQASPKLKSVHKSNLD